MDYVLDTNILLILLRDKQLSEELNNKYQLLQYPNSSVISVVTIGELRSIALQTNWGSEKIDQLQQFINLFLIADINIDKIVKKYAEIDAYSQGKLRNKPLGRSSRNMGKNDLWIAATASVLKLPLLTTDKDFIHLDNIYIELEYIKLT